MLFTNRIYKWHKFFVYRFFYGIFHVFSKPFNRMQQLFGQKMCQDNTDGNNQYQYQYHKMEMLQGTHCKHYVPVLPHG